MRLMVMVKSMAFPKHPFLLPSAKFVLPQRRHYSIYNLYHGITNLWHQHSSNFIRHLPDGILHPCFTVHSCYLTCISRELVMLYTGVQSLVYFRQIAASASMDPSALITRGERCPSCLRLTPHEPRPPMYTSLL